MQKKKLRKMAILGLRWPPETFLQRLINGLALKGINIDLGTNVEVRGKVELSKGLRLMHLPSWDQTAFVRGIIFFRLLLSGLLKSPADVFRFLLYATKKETLIAKLECFYRHLPLAGRRWDLIYFPWNVGAVKYQGLAAFGSPIIVSCRGSQITVAPQSPELAHYTKGIAESFKSASAVHCVSEDICKEAQTLGLDPVKAKIIRPAVDPDYFSPDRNKPPGRAGELNVLGIGTLNWRKAFELAMVAIKKLRDYGIKVNFDIIGEGEDYQRLLFTIHDMGLTQEVHLLGKLPPENVRSRLCASDVFYLSSYTEGISNAVLEAMSCGVPVVTTDCGGMKEAVTNGVEGFLVPVLDPDAAAEALKKLADDPFLRARMGAAGRKRILEQFTLAGQIKEFHGLCVSVIGGG